MLSILRPAHGLAIPARRLLSSVSMRSFSLGLRLRGRAVFLRLIPLKQFYPPLNPFSVNAPVCHFYSRLYSKVLPVLLFRSLLIGFAHFVFYQNIILLQNTIVSPCNGVMWRDKLWRLKISNEEKNGRLLGFAFKFHFLFFAALFPFFLILLSIRSRDILPMYTKPKSGVFDINNLVLYTFSL